MSLVIERLVCAGWFDSYLPALQPVEIEEVDRTKQEVEISDSGLCGYTCKCTRKKGNEKQYK